MKKSLVRKSLKLVGMHDGIYGDVSDICGDASNIRGNVSGIHGDVSGIRGDVSGVHGNLDDCGITDEERKRGVDVQDFVMDTKIEE